MINKVLILNQLIVLTKLAKGLQAISSFHQQQLLASFQEHISIQTSLSLRSI